MVSRRQFLTLVAIGTPALAATAAGIRLLPPEDEVGEFPTLRFGEDTCLRCGMVIDEPPFAAAWRDHANREQLFDDIGCMAYEAHDRALTAAGFFVHDYTSGSWLRADEAVFAISSEITTPMGYGTAAFAGTADAQAHAEQGTIVAWDEVLPGLDKRGDDHGGPH